MAFTFPTTSFVSSSDDDDQFFTAVINRLKSQNALPNHCFQNDIPFFNMPCLPKEKEMRDLFELNCDIHSCRQLLRNINSVPEGVELKMFPQNYSPISVMSFAQIALYKVLPCPDPRCPNCPREIATHNQYKDFEYQCPFYHHERDRRRIVVSASNTEEFVYKANYYEEGRRHGEKDKYSQNYFESMFHPLYYKMFRCKRDFCNHSAFCPFFHNEEEKKTWDDTFCVFVRKDRVSYVKDKQRSQDKKLRGQEGRRRGSSDEDISGQENNEYFKNSPFGVGKMPIKTFPNGFPMYPFLPMPQQLVENFNKIKFTPYRKDSDSSFEENREGFGFFAKLQTTMTF